MRRSLTAAVAMLLASSALSAQMPSAPPATPAAAPAADIPLGKLSDAAVPAAYRLSLTVRPDQATFTGHTEIDVTVARPTASLYMHGNGLKVAKASATVGGRTFTGRFEQVDPLGVARLSFDQPLPAGKATLSFDYEAPFEAQGEGLYHAKVGDDWYAWTQMEPIDARRMFPSFDEPGFKTPFTLSIIAPAALKVLANTPEVKVTPAADGMARHDFAASKPLPTYLVAIAVGAFDVVEGVVPANAVRKTPLPYRVIATKGQAARLKTAAEEGPKILALHEDYFGIPYPFEKLDQIASPIMGGAMENAGLITYQDTLLLLSPDAPLSQRSSFGAVVAHEQAHQWFGDLVTPIWWTDLWLNESFAEWAGNRVGEIWQPGLGTDERQLADALSAMDIDSRGAGRPIRQEITRNDQIASAFDAITYPKGGQVLHMFEGFVGPDKWRKGVQTHLTRFAYKNASSDDFFRSIAAGTGNPAIVPAFQSFVTQTGVPLVTIRPASGGGWTLTQSRYRPLGVASGVAQRWSVPFCARQGDARSCTLLTETSGNLKLTGSGLAIPNAGGAGYYRYSLDDAGWAALMANADKLPAREAMAAADSLWSDFAAGNAKFDRVLSSARVLARHPERSSATWLGFNLQRLSQTSLSAAAQPGYRRLMTSLYGDTFAKLGLDLKRNAYASEAGERRQLRQTLASYIAREARDTALRAKLVTAAEASLGGDAAALDASYRPLALTVAVQDLGAPFVDKLLAAMIASNDPLFRRQAVGALSSGETPALVGRSLMMSQDARLQSAERLQLAFQVARSAAGREALYGLLNTQFDTIIAQVPAFGRNQVPTLFAGYCSVADADRVERLLRPKLTVLGGGELELAQTLEAIRICAALRDAKGAEIEAALK